jgi:uncharacterized tellurite resistance protein B-like protein
MTEFTLHERFAIINILSKIMEADHIIDPREVEFMNKIFLEFEISESDIATINSFEFEQCRSIIRSMAVDKKQNAINLFLEMAKCDGYVDPREIELIEKF